MLEVCVNPALAADFPHAAESHKSAFGWAIATCGIIRLFAMLSGCLERPCQTALCREIRGHERLPLRWVDVVRHAPEKYVQISTSLRVLRLIGLMAVGGCTA
jgi:hypothetical protein